MTRLAISHPGLRRVLRLAGVLLALLPLSAWAQQAEVELIVAGEPPRWAGAQQTIFLELRSDQLSFAEVYFDLPRLEGAFLLRPDSNTIQGTTVRAGTTWQTIRYPLALFAPSGGELNLPAFEVRFKTRDGFGTEASAHRLKTRALTIPITQPPGTAAGDLVVASAGLTLEQRWTRPDDPLVPGNAITLEVTRQATQLSAMLLPPVPVFETPGLAAYPAAPQLADRSNRGQLVGERTDRVTWIIEEPGDYSIPAIRFRWWNPRTETLEDQRVEGIRFTVEAGPDSAPASRNTASSATTPWAGLWAVLALFGVFIVLLRFTALASKLQALRRRMLPPPVRLLPELNPTGPAHKDRGVRR